MRIDLPTALLVCTVIAALLWWSRSMRFARALFSGLLALVILASVPIVPDYADRLYTRAYHPFVAGDLPGAKVIVLLGAATTMVVGRDADVHLLGTAAAARVLEAARVYRMLGKPWVISSGGVSHPSRVSQPSAFAMRDGLVALGVPRDRILLESRSLSTHDEAVLLAPTLRSLGAQRFVLVTSQSHMPRSERVFRAQGLTPVPAIAPDYPAYFIGEAGYRPDFEGLRLTDALAHEWIGLGYYWFKGWFGRP